MEPLINKVPTLEASLTTNYFDNLAGKCMIFTISQTGGDFCQPGFLQHVQDVHLLGEL